MAYNPNTGNSTRFAGAHGKNSGVARIGDNVYAGHDGNVYQKTDNGWQQKVMGNWATRTPPTTANTNQFQNLDRELAARSQGNQRLNNFRSSSQSMNRSFGGDGGGFRHR